MQEIGCAVERINIPDAVGTCIDDCAGFFRNDAVARKVLTDDRRDAFLRARIHAAHKIERSLFACFNSGKIKAFAVDEVAGFAAGLDRDFKLGRRHG